MRDDENQRGSNCDDLAKAALGAEQKLSRMQDAMIEAVQPEGDEEEFVGDMIAELDVAPEIDELREALGMDDRGSSAVLHGRPREKQDLKEAKEKVSARRKRKARPADTPPEYKTWHTGP